MSNDWWSFVSQRIMDLPSGLARELYVRELVLGRKKTLRLIVSHHWRDFVNSVAEKRARELGGRYCYSEDGCVYPRMEGIVFTPLPAGIIPTS